MSPFLKNLKRFFIILFTGASVIIIFIGISRAKKVPTLTEIPTPDQGGAPSDVPVLPPPIDLATSSKPANKPTEASFTGKTYQTPYGTVAVSIQVKDGKIVAVTMPQVPNSPPSTYAKPILIDQALKAGSANIQGVSGATYTSLSFKASLESAIAEAKNSGQTITAPAKSTATAPTPKPSVPRQYYRDDD